MNAELFEALELLEKTKGIPVDYFLGCNGAVITDKDHKTVSDVRCDEDIANSSGCTARMEAATIASAFALNF